MLDPKANDYMITDKIDIAPLVVKVGYDRQLDQLVANLNPAAPWGDRKIAAERLGNLGNADAVPALIDALPNDPFWMVRCAIIQALEKIGDQEAVATLNEVAENDRFQVVQAYAAKAVERLT